MEHFTCCLCGKQSMGWGNNPYPLIQDEKSRCCDSCNDMVIIARIMNLKKEAK